MFTNNLFKTIFAVVIFIITNQQSIFAQATKSETTKAETTKKETTKKETTKKETTKKGVQAATVKVSGNCAMCKRRIEEACVITGVKSAQWNKQTGVLSVTFSDKTNLEKIEASVAKAGYDTERIKATDKAYAKLPQCCQYRAEGAAKH